MCLLSPVVVGALLLTSLLQIAIFPVAGPLPLWRASLAWFALVPLLWLLLSAGKTLRARDWMLLGYANGILFYAGTCYWVYGTMHTYGGLPTPVAAIVLVLFCLYLGLYHALFAGLLALMRRGGLALTLIASPFLWIAVEFARARVTSFPWNLLGYAQIDSYVLTRLAPIAGVYGVSFVLAAVNAAIAAAVIFPRRRVSAIVALSAAILAAGIQNMSGVFAPNRLQGTQKAVLLQPNLPTGAAESADITILAASSAGLSLQASNLDNTPTHLILWPESPSPFQTNRLEFTQPATRLAEMAHAPLIAGAVGLDTATDNPRGYRVYNSAALFLPVQGIAARYDKVHLVPFGEFVPYPSLFSFAGGLTQQVGLFDRGNLRQPLAADGHRYAVFLCYESIFGDEVRQLVRNGGEVLVNLSDDGWYGDSSAPFQHINMARMRAIENHRWLLRDTNNGITAAIDPNGRVVERMERNRRGAAAMHFDYLHDTTFYTRWGDVFAWICVIASVVLLGLAQSQSRSTSSDTTA